MNSIFLVVCVAIGAANAIQDVKVIERLSHDDSNQFFNFEMSPFANWGLEEVWKAFTSVYEKKYISKYEENRRKDVFAQNLNYIKQHNKLFMAGHYSHSVGINEFTDMSPAEFQKRNGFLGAKAQRTGKPAELDFSAALPTAQDWREHGAVTPVKNQGQCGSCYTFSTTGSLEGAHYLKTGKLVSLSEQNLVDCSKPEGNNGCGGGLMDNCFNYIIKNGGIDTESAYPYVGQAGECKFRMADVGATDVSFYDIPSGNETAMKVAVATKGPVSVAIDASHFSFQSYSGGVYTSMFCHNQMNQLDHGVLVVGYGTDEQSGKDFWWVKNSWGPTWGLNGYIKMARNDGNMCGIATCASYPIV